MIISLSICVLLGSLAITRLLINNSSKIAAVDIPNERSSHSKPTPRGGGLAFVTASILGFLFLFFRNEVPRSEITAVAIAGLLVAFAGYLDDHQRIAGATIRLIFHSVGALIIVGVVGLPTKLEILGLSIENNLLLSILGFLYLVWLLNLFNFMDGTDGIAGVEAVFVCAAGAFLNLNSTANFTHSASALIIAASTLGFLFYNWSPAKIFMGDIGSGYLGIVIGGLSLMSAQQNPDLIWVWIILIAVFVSDATITLIRRLTRKQKPHIAHRSHAYQHLAIQWNSHAKVAITISVVNLVWLLPIAYAVSDGKLEGSFGTAIAYIPLLIAMFVLGSGKDPEVN